MANLLDVAVFVTFIVILLQVARPQAPLMRDVQVWTDDVERRMLR